MLDRAEYADFGGHNSIRLEAEQFLNTLAITFISFSGRFVFAVQKHLFLQAIPSLFLYFGYVATKTSSLPLTVIRNLKI